MRRSRIGSLAAVLVFMAVMAATINSAAALTPTLNQGSPNENLLAPQPVTVGPELGDTISLSMKLEGMADANDKYAMTCSITPIGGAPAGGMSVTCKSPLEPNGVSPYTAVDSIKITNTGAPPGTNYSLVVSVNGVKNTYDVGTESRVVSSIPEFPTIAVPVAAVMGLVFIAQRKKRGG